MVAPSFNSINKLKDSYHIYCTIEWHGQIEGQLSINLLDAIE